MKKEKSVRQIDGVGRIVLPFPIRQAMNWSEGTPVEIYVDETGEEVVIKSPG